MSQRLANADFLRALFRRGRGHAEKTQTADQDGQEAIHSCQKGLLGKLVAARENVIFEAHSFFLARFMNCFSCCGREDDSRNGLEKASGIKGQISLEITTIEQNPLIWNVNRSGLEASDHDTRSYPRSIRGYRFPDA